MFFYSRSPIILREMETKIATKIGHTNSSWHKNMVKNEVYK